VKTGLAIACALRKLHPNDWKVADYGRLLVNAETLAAVTAGKSYDEIVGLWAKDLADFRERRTKAIFYGREFDDF
jgi:hypothetical protein